MKKYGKLYWKWYYFKDHIARFFNNVLHIRCMPCKRWRLDLRKRRMNTAYHDDKQNYVVCCVDCFQEICENYQDLWETYRSG